MIISTRRAWFALALGCCFPLVSPFAIPIAHAQIAPAPTSLRAVVRDAAGAPVAGADVVVVLHGEDDEETLTFKTDEQGRITIERDQSPAKKVAEIFVYAPGYALQRAFVGADDDGEITLKAGVTATGKVVDEGGKPIAGATVALDYLVLSSDDEPDARLRYLSLLRSLRDSALKNALIAQTGTDGTWKLAGLPIGSNAIIEVADPRYARDSVEVAVGENDANAPDLALKPGAIIRGRVLTPDGKPVANANIQVNIGQGRGSYASATSGADGTYVVESLPAGAAKISVSSPFPDLAPTSIKGVVAKASETVNAPEVRLSAGVLLSGQVTDTETKAPLAGARVMAMGDFGSAPSAATGKDGKYSVRVPTGQTRFYLYSTPTDYLRGNFMDSNLNVGLNSTKAPDFALQRGLTLTGTARDESGAPAVAASISAGSMFDGAQTTVDAQGNWTIHGAAPKPNGRTLPKGKIELKSAGTWQIVGDGLVSSRAGEAIALTLRHIELQDITLRVVTPTGEPVADSKVRVAIVMDPTNRSTRFESATTNARGEVTIKNLRPDESAEITPAKDGYALQKAGVIHALKANETRASDAILTPENGVLRGRIVDANGAPVAGARVAVLWPGDLRDAKSFAQSDADGQFALENLSVGELIVGAARGRDWGQVTAQTGEQIELKLASAAPQPAPRDRALARELLAQGFADGKEDYTLTGLAAQMAAQEPENAAQFAAIVGADNKQWFEQGLADVLAKRDSARAIELARAEFDKAKKTEEHTNDALDLAELLIQNGDTAGARAVYQSVAPAAIAATRGAAPDDAISTSYRYAQLAGISGAVEHPDAEFWIELLDRSLPAQPNDEMMFRIGGYMEAFARSDAKGAVAFMDTLAPAAQVRAYEDVIPLVARRDLPQAQQLLAKMEALVANNDIPVEPDRNDAMYRPTPARSLNVARGAIIRALLPTNARAAYELATKVTTDGYEMESLQIDAALRLPKDEALPILRAQFALAQGQGNRSASKMARLARLVAPLDADLSEQWFELARAQLASKNEYDDDYREMAAPYGFYRAANNPAQSRLLLENEWQRIINAKADSGYSRASRLQNIVWAMVPLNWERALQMMREKDGLLGEQNMDGAITQRNFVTWLLASEQQRNELDFERPSIAELE